MTTTQHVNKETIKALVLLHGQREAARIAGLNEDTVCSWAHRYGWSKIHKEIASKPQAKTGNTQQISKIAENLKKNESMTRLSLSRAHRIHAARAARGKLSPKETLQTAQGAAITHQWKAEKEKDQSNVAVNIAILNV